MRRRWAFTALLIASFAGAGAIACNALTGVSGLIASEEPEAGTLEDSAAPRNPDAGIDPAPTCSCVAAPPADWSGPLLVLEGNATAAAGACPTGLSASFEGGIDPAGAPGCTPCSCGAVAGAACDGTATVKVYRQMVCGSACNQVFEVGTTCTTVKYCDPSVSAIVSGNFDGGSCTPKGGALSAVTWARSAVACGFASAVPATCPAGQACAPASAAAPSARTCILHAGDVMCPSGAFAGRTVYEGALSDTRSCTSCTCDSPSGRCTGGTVSLFTDTTCTNLVKDVPSSATCGSFSVQAPDGSGKVSTPPKDFDGGCAADGGAYGDGGAVTASNPTTLCCL